MCVYKALQACQNSASLSCFGAQYSLASNNGKGLFLEVVSLHTATLVLFEKQWRTLAARFSKILEFGGTRMCAPGLATMHVEEQVITSALSRPGIAERRGMVNDWSAALPYLVQYFCAWAVANKRSLSRLIHCCSRMGRQLHRRDGRHLSQRTNTR